MKEPISFFPSENPVQLDCELNLDTIYRTNRERNEFENRLDAFLRADEDARSIYELDGNRLRYKTENLVPPKIDGRNPLLLIFGNPASHSVSSGMFFSPKRDGEEHRFWKHLLNTDEIRGLSLGKELSRLERNKKRLELILKGEYESAFIIGLCVYISMPSSAVVGWQGSESFLAKRPLTWWPRRR